MHLAVTYHSLFLSVCIADSATDLTLAILLSIDFLINLGFTGRAWQLRRAGGRGEARLGQVLQLLVLNEVT